MKREELVQQIGFDPGEWLIEWIRKSITNQSLALPIGMTGPTGTGKSLMAWAILWDCVIQGDCVIIPGDMLCEFRHFLEYLPSNPDVSLRVLMPYMFKYNFVINGKPDYDLKSVLEKHGGQFIEYNPYKENINAYIEPQQILVIVDTCFTLDGKSWLWQYTLKQIKHRIRYNQVEITYCFPEASTYWPNQPYTEQYKPVYYHSKDFVEFRKAFMRGIYIYHHSSMLFYLIEKQFETIIKKGSSYDKRTPIDNKRGRGKLIHEYSIIHQGIEDVGLEMEGKFHEMKDNWKIIPLEEIEFDLTLEAETDQEEQSEPEPVGKFAKKWKEQRDEFLIMLWDSAKSQNPNLTQREFAKNIGINYTTFNQILAVA